MTGLDGIIGVGTDVEFSCTVSRIKPAAEEIYWTVAGTRVSGSVQNTTNSDGTLSQTNKVTYKLVF